MFWKINLEEKLWKWSDPSLGADWKNYNDQAYSRPTD